MTNEEFYKVFDNEDTNWDGDNCYQGFQIIAKYTDNIVCAAGHDQIWSEGVDELVEKGITLEDANALRRLNWMIDEDSLSCFV